MTGNETFTPRFRSMSCIQARWDGIEPTDSPRSWVLRFSNSGASSENATNSVVQTGVKSAGWLKKSTHLPALVRSDSRIGPCVVTASKSGAGSFSRGRLGVVAAVSGTVIGARSFRVVVRH